LFRRALAAAAVLLLFACAPAIAHTDLESSDPKDGATLESAPEQLTLTFGEDLLSQGGKLTAKDDTGVQVNLGPVQVKGARLTAAWPATADAGTYSVAYRAVAADGHPLEGRIRFTVTPSGQTPTASATPVTATEPPPQPSASNPWIVAAPLLLIAALAAGGLYVWRSRE
jgi:methionine-rich copper-binding protein CopC